MFETKRTLRKRIEQFEREIEVLRGKQFVSAVIEEKALPKCESMACAGCQKAVFYRDAWNYTEKLIGCGKDIFCKDYLPVNVTPEVRREKIQTDLLERGAL